MADSESTQRTESIEGKEVTKGNEPLVLLVQKEAGIVSLISQLLRAEGYQVHDEDTAQKARHYLENRLNTKQAAPDLTLLDDLEHESDVVAFLETLEARSNTPPRVILFSELPRHKFEELHVKIRAVGIVVEPNDTKDLLRIMRATIGPGSQSDLTQELNNSLDLTTD